KVTLVDTGTDTMTGGRLKRVAKYLDPSEDFCMTYGDGVSDLDINELIKFHRTQKLLATVTATRPPGRFGAIKLNGSRVDHFQEKPSGDGGYINGGFFVLSPRVLDYVESDATVWEQEPMKRLAADSQLAAFKYDGFWQPMDTIRDKNYLESLWVKNKAPWKRWK
ncbi:MAG TPA: sugar phosphate nucleotidyltransferase, partial [Bdellovibrionota bacterium]|nr:sugar phosphate nucleotidyltransferase [Bdellovibrionota bacterium]